MYINNMACTFNKMCATFLSSLEIVDRLQIFNPYITIYSFIYWLQARHVLSCLQCYKCISWSLFSLWTYGMSSKAFNSLRITLDFKNGNGVLLWNSDGRTGTNSEVKSHRNISYGYQNLAKFCISTNARRWNDLIWPHLRNVKCYPITDNYVG